MAYDSEIGRVICEHLHDPSSGFSVGSFGAIAEFHRNIGEPLNLDDPERLTVATDRIAWQYIQDLAGRRGKRLA